MDDSDRGAIALIMPGIAPRSRHEIRPKTLRDFDSDRASVAYKFSIAARSLINFYKGIAYIRVISTIKQNADKKLRTIYIQLSSNEK